MAKRDYRAAYDTASDAYARKYIHELDHKPFDRELLEQFALIVGPNRPVLDIGCGPGHTTAYLASLGLSASGVDLSPKMVKKAAEIFPQLRFEVGDFFHLKNESSSIDGILAFYCIVHLTPDELVAVFSMVAGNRAGVAARGVRRGPIAIHTLRHGACGVWAPGDRFLLDLRRLR